MMVVVGMGMKPEVCAYQTNVLPPSYNPQPCSSSWLFACLLLLFFWQFVAVVFNCTFTHARVCVCVFMCVCQMHTETRRHWFLFCHFPLYCLETWCHLCSPWLWNTRVKGEKRHTQPLKECWGRRGWTQVLRSVQQVLLPTEPSPQLFWIWVSCSPG